MTPSLPIRSALAVVVLTIAAAVSGCGPAINTGTTTSASTNVASLRFINGSTNAPTVDAYLNATTNLPIASNLIYAQVGSVININIEPNIVLLVQKSGTTDSTTPGDRLGSCALPALTGGDAYTIVLTGDVTVTSGPTAFQCDIFNETVTASTSFAAGDYYVKFHHAAPLIAASGTSSVSFGTYVPNPSPSPVTTLATPVPATYNAPIGTASFTAPTGTSNVAVGVSATAAPQPGVTAAPGIGVYASTVTTAAPTSVLQYVNPVSAQYGFSLITGASDSTDVLPFSTSSTFGVFMLDGAVGQSLTPKLISVMD